MSLTVNIYYTRKNGSAKKFAEEMISSGLVERVRSEVGNLRYEYFIPFEGGETVLLVDQWENQEAIELHHKSPIMKEISNLREKYKLKVSPHKYMEIK